jgi:hypothetical protein
MMTATTETTFMGTFTANCWTPPAEPMPEQVWLAALHEVVIARESCMWQLGDIWAYGDRTYGNRRAITKAPDWRGPSFGACRNAAVVATAFKETSRRHDVLSFKHHAEVAALPEATADDMLDWAERERKSTRELRQRVKAWKANPSGVDIGKRVEDYLASRSLTDWSKDRLRITAKRAPELAMRVLNGELKINTAWTVARDREKEAREREDAEREESIARRRAQASTTAVVVPLRRTLDEEREHVRNAAAMLKETSQALRRLTDAKVSAHALMMTFDKKDRDEIEASLRTGLPFLRNVITTWSVNRSDENEHPEQAANGGSGIAPGLHAIS